MLILVLLLITTFIIISYTEPVHTDFENMLHTLTGVEIWSYKNGHLSIKSHGQGPLLIVSDLSIPPSTLNHFKVALIPYIPKYSVNTTLIYTPLTIQSNILKQSKRTFTDKTKFCCIVLLQVTPETQEVIDTLWSYGSIDVISIPPNPETIIPKLEDYKFVLALEPESNDGLLSCVLFLAASANCIPIYSGDVSITETWLNKKRFIDCRDYDVTDDILNHIRLLNENETLWTNVVNQPLYTNLPPFLDNQILKERILSSV
jgi:hypothetical protein